MGYLIVIVIKRCPEPAQEFRNLLLCILQNLDQIRGIPAIVEIKI